jgi:hypothetical protein
MKLIRDRRPILAFLLLLSYLPGRAQTPTTEFRPELDAHFGLSSNTRIVIQDKQRLSGSRLIGAEFGPSIEFYLKPVRLLRNVTHFDLDETKSVPLSISIGYRALIDSDKPTTNRLESVATLHQPLWNRILFTDKNRIDIDWTNGSFYWRYRNQLTAERRLNIRSYHPGPYISAEPFYTSKYVKWSTTRLYVGCLLPLGENFNFDLYYEHDNDTGSRPTTHTNTAGFVLNLYFPKH